MSASPKSPQGTTETTQEPPAATTTEQSASPQPESTAPSGEPDEAVGGDTDDVGEGSAGAEEEAKEENVPTKPDPWQAVFSAEFVPFPPSSSHSADRSQLDCVQSERLVLLEYVLNSLCLSAPS
jgi:hypothetical protein